MAARRPDLRWAADSHGRRGTENSFRYSVAFSEFSVFAMLNDPVSLRPPFGRRDRPNSEHKAIMRHIQKTKGSPPRMQPPALAVPVPLRRLAAHPLTLCWLDDHELNLLTNSPLSMNNHSQSVREPFFLLRKPNPEDDRRPSCPRRPVICSRNFIVPFGIHFSAICGTRAIPTATRKISLRGCLPTSSNADVLTARVVPMPDAQRAGIPGAILTCCRA